jgi:hypothetical protein
MCLYCDVRITRWTDAPISWPRCAPVGQGAGSGLFVDEELLRAIRTESVLVLWHWWGVSEGTVTCWRNAFGIGQWGAEGSQILHAASSEKGAEVLRGRTPSE